MGMKINKDLVIKYNQPVPRYTSYPTVPFWKDFDNAENWKAAFETQFSIHNKEEGISLYIHLPFCEALCSFCGCNKRITTDHKVETEYLDVPQKEWQKRQCKKILCSQNNVASMFTSDRRCGSALSSVACVCFQ